MSNQFSIEVVSEIPATPVASRLYLTKPVGENRFHLAWLASDGTTMVTTLRQSDIGAAVQEAIDNLTIVADTADKLTTPRNINGVPFDGTANITINAVDATPRIAATEKGQANGVASLDGDGLVPLTQLPTLVTSVAGKTGSVTLLKADVGLGNVDNTADTAKSVFSASKLTASRLINGVPFDGTSNITVNAVDLTARIAVSEKGQANGVATLDSNGLVPSGQLPSYVDDVIEAADFASLPVTGETSKIYVTVDDNKQFRWSGSAYVIINAGDVLSVAGKKGVVTLVKADVGLGNVDNTADAAKNVLTATKLATARNISTTGDATGTGSFDGSANLSFALTLATVNSSPVTDGFVKATVNAKGLVTATSAVGASDITSALGFTPLNKAGDTVLGTLTVAPTSGIARFGVNAVAGQQAHMDFSTAGSVRWRWVKDGVTEAGANVGSDLAFNRYADNGSLIDTVISFIRATGKTIFNKVVKFADSVLVGTDTVYNGAAVTVNGRVSASDGVNPLDCVNKGQLDAAIASAANGMQIVFVTTATQAMVKDKLYVIIYEAGPSTLTFPTASNMSPGDNFWILNISSRIDHVLGHADNLLQGDNEDQDFNMTKKTAQYKYISATYGLYLMN